MKKLKWKYQPIQRRWLAEYQPNRYYVIDRWSTDFHLQFSKTSECLVFKKLYSAKKVAQLIHNG